MSRRFVLDDSVVYGALAEDAGGTQCLRAIHILVRRCDVIAWSGNWLATCHSHISAKGHTTRGKLLLNLLNQVLRNSDKNHEGTSGAEPLPDERGIHHKDLWVVRLSRAADACLVTTDKRLASALEAKGISWCSPGDVAGE